MPGIKERLLPITDNYEVDPLLKTFRGKGFISVDQIQSKAQLNALFHHTDFMKAVIEANAVYEPLKGRSLVVLFYQPSTRTYFSFNAAGQRLGSYVMSENGMEEFSSVSKGENLGDTVQSAIHTTHAEALILRHPDDNSSKIAQDHTEKPIFNAGSGTKEHPSQALLDAYTIENTVGLKNIHVAMVGDLLFGRTVKSLAKLLAVGGENITITMVSAKELRMPAELVAELRQKGINVVETESLESVIEIADVIYMTRIQEEWFKKEGRMDDYERLKSNYVLTERMANRMKENAIIHHPLPRKGEIPQSVDKNPRAQYFNAMGNGLFLRAALIDAALNDAPGQIPD